jgi:hypothetical protein
VKPSRIAGAGRGLFARRDISANEQIADYTVGTIKRTHTQHTAKYPSNNATHTMLINNAYYDALDARKSIAGMANHIAHSRANAVMGKTGKLKAKHRIKAGTEIRFSYGPDYKL